MLEDTLTSNNSKDAQNQTIPIKFTDSETIPMERLFKSSQTNPKYLKNQHKADIFINDKIVNTLMEDLSRLEQEEKHFIEYDNLRKHKKIALILQKVVEIDMVIFILTIFKKNFDNINFCNLIFLVIFIRNIFVYTVVQDNQI